MNEQKQMDIARVTIETIRDSDTPEYYNRSVVIEENDELEWSLVWALRKSQGEYLWGLYAKLIHLHTDTGLSIFDKPEDAAIAAKETAFIAAANDYYQALEDRQTDMSRRLDESRKANNTPTHPPIPVHETG